MTGEEIKPRQANNDKAKQQRYVTNNNNDKENNHAMTDDTNEHRICTKEQAINNFQSQYYPDFGIIRQRKHNRSKSKSTKSKKSKKHTEQSW